MVQKKTTKTPKKTKALMAKKAAPRAMKKMPRAQPRVVFETSRSQDHGLTGKQRDLVAVACEDRTVDTVAFANEA